jgi:methylmalonyl-CoA mutase
VTVPPWPAAPQLPATQTAKPLAAHRLAEPFERLRDAADACPKRPTVFLASLGTPAEYGARSTWIANFLAAGGIAVKAGESFTASADAGRAFAASGATIACLCASDTVYGELGEATAMALKGAGATRVYLAGRPREQEAALKAAGVDGFIFAGIDALETLARLHRELGAGSGAAG